MDKRQYTPIAFFHLKKPFRSVDHPVLPNKMKVYGLAGNEITWFQSYLGYRKKAAESMNILTNDSTLNCGSTMLLLSPITHFDLHE